MEVSQNPERPSPEASIALNGSVEVHLGRDLYLTPEAIAIAGLVDEIDQRIRSRNDKRD